MYDNFLFRKKWWDIIKGLPSEQRCEVMDTINNYLFDGVEPQFEQVTAAAIAVQFILQDIRTDKERYDDISEKRREAGRKGGQQNVTKQNQANESKTKQNQANESKTKQNQANEILLENATKQNQANQANQAIRIKEEEKEKNNTTTTTTTPPAPARERLAQWVAESELVEWIRLKFSQSGYSTEIDIGALLDDFYDNDFIVRERCERGERMEVLKHFQNWLPKYLNKLKNENNNEQQHRNIRATADGTPANAAQRKPYSRISQLANTEFDIE